MNERSGAGRGSARGRGVIRHAAVAGLSWVIWCGLATTGCNDNDNGDGGADAGISQDLTTAASADLRSVPVDSGTTAVDSSVAVDAAADSAGPTSHTVHVGPSGQFVFAPASLTIKVGDSVTWVWDSSTHTVTSGPPTCVADNKFCDPSDTGCSSASILNAGATYTHQFTTAGTFPYFC